MQMAYHCVVSEDVKKCIYRLAAKKKAVARDE
jgi:hypothetical protein